jgi:hypothetical protein
MQSCGILIHIRLFLFFILFNFGKQSKPSTTLFSIPDAWTAAWSASLPVNGDLIVDPTVRTPGFDLRRHNWMLLKRFKPSREDSRTSCIDGGSWSHQLVTVVLRSKQCVT